MEPNDLALAGMTYALESSVVELLGEEPRTPKPEVQDYVLR